MEKRRFPWAIALVIAVVLLLLIASRFAVEPSPNDRAISLLQDAQAHSKSQLEKYQSGEALQPQDKIDLTQADRDFSQLESLKPDEYKFFLGAGYVEVALEDWSKALGNLTQALEKAPKKPTPEDQESIAQVHFLESRALLQTGKQQESLKEAAEAVRLKEIPDYLWAKASAELELHRVDDAQKDVERAIQIDPGHQRSLSLLKFIGEKH